MGRELVLKVDYFDGSTQWTVGDVFRVVAPITDQGVVLCDPAGKLTPWSRDWKAIFKKVRKTKKKK